MEKYRESEIYAKQVKNTTLCEWKVLQDTYMQGENKYNKIYSSWKNNWVSLQKIKQSYKNNLGKVIVITEITNTCEYTKSNELGGWE